MLVPKQHQFYTKAQMLHGCCQNRLQRLTVIISLDLKVNPNSCTHHALGSLGSGALAWLDEAALLNALEAFQGEHGASS